MQTWDVTVPSIMERTRILIWPDALASLRRMPASFSCPSNSHFSNHLDWADKTWRYSANLPIMSRDWYGEIIPPRFPSWKHSSSTWLWWTTSSSQTRTRSWWVSERARVPTGSRTPGSSNTSKTSTSLHRPVRASRWRSALRPGRK